MNNKQRIAEGAPRIRLVAPTAALASGLLSTAAWGAPGDLDPAFGDVGRSIGWPGTTGSLWALQPLPDDDLLFSGCGTYYEDCISTAYAGRLDGNGSLDRLLAEALLGQAVVYDFARQPDGKVVAAGVLRGTASEYGVVFRLLPDGTLDKAFGTDGLVRLTGSEYAMSSVVSLALDQAGRIAVAGQRGSSIVVVRLLSSGVPDAGFGAPGGFVSTFSGPGMLFAVGGGGYRLLVSQVVEPGKPPRCRVQALTADGQVDAGYGDGGLSQAEALPVGWCYSAAADASGRLVIGGETSAGSSRAAFLARLLGNGAADPSFDAGHVATSMVEVSDLAVDGTGRIVITGQDRAGLSGVLVSRLQADGRLDEAFGRGGMSRIALPTSWPDNFRVEDLQLASDGSIVVGGGAWTHTGGQPFVARLLGGASGGGPGVLGAKFGSIEAREAEGRAIVTVERIAGRTGAVSVGYSTFAFPASDGTATAGVDFTPVQGRLTWADGDDSERQIVVPLIADASGVERQENFEVRLDDAMGAGLALDRATVNIVGDAYPAGMFRIEARSPYREEEGSMLVIVHRDEYSKGEVSVLVSVTGGSAQEGSDYRFPAPVRLTWRDGEWNAKTVDIVLVNDATRESQETIEVSLSDATGGALIGQTKSVTVAINDGDSEPSGSGSGGGGGGNGGGPLALLAAAAAWLRWLSRRASRYHRCRPMATDGDPDDPHPQERPASRRLPHARRVRAACRLLDAVAGAPG
jgi:uncharacterized delta-60 repeat protein